MYTWKKPNTTCTTALARNFTGMVIHGDANPTLVATDGSMVLLALGNETRRCNHDVITTQFEDIFVILNELHNDTLDDQFKQPINMDLQE